LPSLTAGNLQDFPRDSFIVNTVYDSVGCVREMNKLDALSGRKKPRTRNLL